MLNVIALNPARFIGALSLILATGFVGCGSPVEAPSADAGSSMPALKGGAGAVNTPVPTETEPNDNIDVARDIIGSILGGSVRGTISTGADVDIFLTHGVLPGREVSASLTVPAGKNYDLQLLDEDGVTVLASSRQAAGRSEQVRLKNTTRVEKQYYLKVYSADGSFSTTATYTLTVGKVI